MIVPEKFTVYTIGHSTHSADYFISLLQTHGINALVDVRSQPFSRYNPQFNKDALSSELKKSGIAYVFIGKELGARSDDPACYVDGHVQYDRLSQTSLFRTGIERVLEGAKRYRIALMCAEKEPLDCHRTVLVARSLEREGVTIQHILADGQLEDQKDTMSRLLDIVGLPQEDMFHSHAQLVDDACRLRENKNAYVDEAHSEISERVEA